MFTFLAPPGHQTRHPNGGREARAGARGAGGSGEIAASGGRYPGVFTGWCLPVDSVQLPKWLNSMVYGTLW